MNARIQIRRMKMVMEIRRETKEGYYYSSKYKLRFAIQVHYVFHLCSYIQGRL